MERTGRRRGKAVLLEDRPDVGKPAFRRQIIAEEDPVLADGDFHGCPEGRLCDDGAHVFEHGVVAALAGRHLDRFSVVLKEPDPGQRKAAALDGDPAGALEQFIAGMGMHDELVDRA